MLHGNHCGGQSNDVHTIIRAKMLPLLFFGLCMLPACNRGENPGKAMRGSESLMIELTSAALEETRAAAAKQLGERRESRAVQPLIQALGDVSPIVRLTAVEALGELADHRAVTPLIGVLRNDHRNIKMAAARSLGRLQDPRAALPLVWALNEIEDDALAALVSLDETAIPALLSGLEESTSRPGSIQALAMIGPPAVEPLIAALARENKPFARLAAATALSYLSDERAASALRSFLKTDSAERVAATYRFLICSGTPESESTLVAALKTIGTPAMARDFTYSGNQTLKLAADEFVKRTKLAPPAPDPDGSPLWGRQTTRSVQTHIFHFDHSVESSDGLKPAQTKGASFVGGKFGTALTLAPDGILSYPVEENFQFAEGTVEMWIALKFDGTNPVYHQHNHPLLLYPAPNGDQFIVSENRERHFYAGTLVSKRFAGVGAGDISSWRAGDWHHLAFTYSAKGPKSLFIDGVKTVELLSEMPAPQAGTPNFAIAGDPWGQASLFLVDELLLSSAVKSPIALQADAYRSKPLRDKQ
jgi:hypothetical protein